MKVRVTHIAASPLSLLDAYRSSHRKKVLLFLLLLLGLFTLTLLAIALGSYNLPLASVLRALIGEVSGPAYTVIWSIRLPRITAAVVCGWGLALAGMVFQSLLKNPLASPSTLGISQGAAFGAAFAIIVLGAGGLAPSGLRTQGASALTVHNLYTIAFFAFAGAMVSTLVILGLARFRKLSAEAVVLAGIAMASIYTSGTVLLQYFASELELAAAVFWSFGDVTRSSWREIALTAAFVFAVTTFFYFKRWDLNALASGEEAAKGVGVEVEKFRVYGMILATAVSAIITCFHGVIAFLGLLAPHIARILVGADHRFLLWHSCLIGSILLLLADTIGRVIVGSGTLPVGVLTSFMGGPLFIYLLVRGDRK